MDLLKINLGDVRQQINLLEAKGNALLDTAKSLREALSVLEDFAAKDRILEPNSNGSPKSRMEQLTDFLREKGPMLRKDILKQIEMPKGTIGVYLTRENFTRDDEGRWYVDENEEEWGEDEE